MSCPVQSKDNAEILLAYANRTLDPDTAAVMERHLESCAGCRRIAEAQKAVWAALDEWDKLPVPADFDRRLYERIESEENRGWWRRLAPVTPFSWRPAMPLAAAAMSVLAIFLLQSPDRIDQAPLRVETVEAEQVERSLQDLDMLRMVGPIEQSGAEAGERSI